LTKKQCKAIKRNGSRCENQTQSRSDYCHVHAYLGNKQYIKSLNEKYNPNSHTRVIIKAKDWDIILPLLGLILFIGGIYQFVFKDNVIGFILGAIGFLILTAVDNQSKKNS
jgi:hypothetical protein